MEGVPAGRRSTPFSNTRIVKKHPVCYTIMSGVDCQAPSLRLIHHLKGRGSVKKRTPLYLAILGAFVLIFVEIARYSYINRGLMRQENVSHLQLSYA